MYVIATQLLTEPLTQPQPLTLSQLLAQPQPPTQPQPLAQPLALFAIFRGQN